MSPQNNPIDLLVNTETNLLARIDELTRNANPIDMEALAGAYRSIVEARAVLERRTPQSGPTPVPCPLLITGTSAPSSPMRINLKMTLDGVDLAAATDRGLRSRAAESASSEAPKPPAPPIGPGDPPDMQGS